VKHRRFNVFGDGKNMLMSQKEQTLMTPYLQFNRHQWAALRDSVPMTLTEEEITRLKGINEDLSLEEVAEIYLPLSRLLNFYISSNLRRQAVLEQFLGTNGQRIPYIISIAGSVAVGKAPPPAYCRPCLAVGRSIAMSNSLPLTVFAP
jgi:type I pantothenate kinase